MNEIDKKAIDGLKADELGIDELDAVNGGGKLLDLYHRIVATYRFYTRTIKDIATTLP
jgi:hypothetical protein